MLLFYAYFDAGVWNETSVVIYIQFPLPNDIDNVKLYCIPWYVDFEARTNMATRRQHFKSTLGIGKFDVDSGITKICL